MTLNNLIEQIEKSVSLGYFICQMITIICLFLYGYYVLMILSDTKKDKGNDYVIRILLAYPMGLALFSIIAYVMVSFAIPYNAVSVAVGCVLVATLTYFLIAKKYGDEEALYRIKLFASEFTDKRALIAFLAVILAAAVACFGILSVTVSNDTMYNFSFYPRAIVYFQGLKVTFDTFLTDVGQGCALINTLPFLYGFNESFGLQHMLNFSFIGLFYVAVNNLFHDFTKGQRAVFSGVITALLLCTLPFVLMSKWVLANEYFAVFMFISVFLSAKSADEGRWNPIIISVFISAMSITRIEGGIFAALLILGISVFDYTNKQLGFGMLLPVLFLHATYSARIFLTMDITAPYLFLTPKKALIMIAILVLVLIYLLFVRGRIFVKLFSHLKLLIFLGLIGVNVLLFIKDSSTYIINLKAFVNNVLFNGGWGVLPTIVFAIYLICLIFGIEIGYWDFMAFSYLLYAIAIAFMRDDGLHPGIGDSGNRVMLQVVPPLLFAAVSHLPKLIKKST